MGSFILQILWDVSFVVFPFGRPLLVDMSLFTEEIDDSFKSGTFSNRDLYRECTLTKLLDLLKHAIKVSVLFVHH